MKPRLYLETTIPSYVTAWPSRDLVVAAHQQITKEWWRTRREAFDVYASQFVLDEAAGGDPEAARERLELLSAFSLLNIAISAVHGIDYLMTWNCAHIANATIIKTVRRVCEQNGFSCPIICTPEELLEASA